MKNIGEISPESELQKKKRELREVQASLVEIGRRVLTQERLTGVGLEVNDDKALLGSLHQRESELIGEISKLG